MKVLSLILGAFFLFSTVSDHVARAAVTTLYDGSLNSLPAAQGWLYLTNPLFTASAAQSVAGGIATLDTTPVQSDQAGYFGFLHPQIPALDRNAGFTVNFDLRVASESHSKQNRAGFSVTALSQDLRGIEVGIWEDEIWAQSGPDFEHAEGIPIDTASSFKEYDLTILGDSYYLFADGAAILTGALRDYSSFGAPYDIGSLLFLGDNTTSASALAELRSIALGTGDDTVIRVASVPLPAALPLFLTALIGLGVVGWTRKVLSGGDGRLKRSAL